MTTRYELLTSLHALLKPRTYLEVGVQLGTSLQLAHAAQVAIGIDPLPLVTYSGNQQIFSMTADDFFADPWPLNGEVSYGPIDMAFIDGSHLFEDALRDFMNIERYAHAGTVVVFDDVLPYSALIAGREMIAGDWTGDAWKVAPIIEMFRPWLNTRLVDVMPTGAFVVWGFGDKTTPGLDLLPQGYDELVAAWLDLPVPQGVIERTHAIQPGALLARLEGDLNL